MPNSLVNACTIPPIGNVDLPYPMDEDNARQFMRRILMIKKLPDGASFWYNKPIQITNYEY